MIDIVDLRKRFQCAKCRCLDVMFYAPNWEECIPPNWRDKILCRACFKELNGCLVVKENIDELRCSVFSPIELNQLRS